jgi:hypothetical protein
MMQKCPFCAEEIQDAAIKCKHCGAFLAGSAPSASAAAKLPWYFGKTFLVIAFLSVGPLALPLLWWHPRLSLAWKVGLSIGILVLSWFLYLATLESLRTLEEYYRLLDSL